MDFLKLFDEWLVNDEQWDRKSHYASDATACRRQLYWRWKNEPMSDPPTAGNYLKMRMGNTIENDLVQGAIAWMVETERIKDFTHGEKFAAEIEGCEYEMHLKLDFVLWPMEGDPVINEVKSSFGRGITTIKNEGVPKEAHLVQCRFYLEHTPYDTVVIPYLGRDNGYRCQFLLRLDDEGNMICTATDREGEEYTTRVIRIDLESYYDKFRFVEAAVKADTLPDREYMVAIKNGEIKDSFQADKVKYKSDWQCQYCGFKSTCWDDVVAEYTEGNNSEDFAIHKEIEEQKVAERIQTRSRDVPDLEEEA